MRQLTPVALLVTLLLESGCHTLPKRPRADPPPFPLEIAYSRDGGSVCITVDEFRVVVLGDMQGDRLYGKFAPEDFEALQSLVAGEEFRGFLRTIRDAGSVGGPSDSRTVGIYGQPYYGSPAVSYYPVLPRLYHLPRGPHCASQADTESVGVT